MRYVFHAFMNEAPGHFFDGYDPKADPLLVYGGSIAVDGATDADALDKAYTVGNRMARDADGRAWPQFVRSLSTGDLLVAEPNDFRAYATTWAVESVGFKDVYGADLNLGPYHFKADTLSSLTEDEAEAAYARGDLS
jgi:hypothetical protein